MKFLRTLADPDTSQGHYRLRVEYDDRDGDTLIELAEDKLTSGSPDAQRLKNRGSMLCLRRGDLEWVIAAMEELRDALDKEGLL